jgi:hypothetical protein
MRKGVILLAIAMIVSACGVDGDPGHCYFSLDWEYYSEEYGVYYYEDNNPDVPESSEIIAGFYYDCYPGRYDFYYESEDPEFIYTYTGYYTLYQNPGLPGGLMRDGPDGADTYVDLYLLVYAEEDDLILVQQNSMLRENPGNNSRVGLSQEPSENIRIPGKARVQPVKTIEFNHSTQHDEWTMEFTGTCSVFRKEF